MQAAGCFTGRTNDKETSTVGNTLYTFYTVVAWCASGNTVTSASLRDAGGETQTPGWRYEGVTASDGGVVANEARAYASHRFILGAGPWDVITADECLRARRTADGTGLSDRTCGIF